MLKSIPINDKNHQKSLCEKCNIPYNENELAYEITFGENSSNSRTAILTFCITTENNTPTGYIKNITEKNGEKNDEQLIAFFIAIRGVLNFLDLHGIKDVFFDNITNDKIQLAKMVGFVENIDKKYFINLKGFFDGNLCEMTK